jgi:diguanylate cyclase (GGDEF)-like protein/PAS domain S-box-containing protein
MLPRSIRSRLIGLVVATVVPFTALIAAGLWNQWSTERASAIRRSVVEARIFATEVDDHINNLDNLLIGISHSLSLDPADTAANDDLLRRVKNDLPNYFANLMLFAPDGTNIGTSLNTRRINPRQRAYFKQVLAGNRRAISDVIRSQLGHEWVVAYARAVEDEQRNLRAVLVVGTLLEHFQDALKLSRLPPGTVVKIVDEKGIVIASSVDPANWIGRDLTAEFESPGILTRQTGEIMQWPDGSKRITGSAPANLVPWLVSVGLPTETALAAISSRLGWAAVFVAVTLMVSFGIAWMLSGKIVRPLRQLGSDASALAAGRLSHRAQVRTGDEVGNLADSFNAMAAALEHREEEAQRAAQQLRHANDTLAAVIDASPVAIVCSDLERRIFIWSRAAEQMFGYTAEETKGRPAHSVPPKQSPDRQGLFERAIRGEIVRDLRSTRRRKDDTLIDVRAAAAPIYNSDGSIRGVVRAYEDISDQVRAEEQLKRIAHYDQLTGLPNRLSLQKELNLLLANEGASTAIAMFDLDGFKDVNDTLGHSTGDRLLIDVGRRLVEVAGHRGQVCRLGGDEFVVIFSDCGNPVTIGSLVDAMLKRLSEPYIISDHVLHVGGSAGIAVAPADATTVDELIANADLALYRAKSDGGRVYRFFLPVLRAQAQARRSLDLDLRRAYAENEFELYFQPQVRLSDRAIVGAEALLRWRHPVAGILAPGAFIDTLSASAIAPDMSRWIVRKACLCTAVWRADGLPLSRIGVNLFPSQLSDHSLLHDLDEALRDTGLPPEVLELEITENVALNLEDAASLQTLHERGIKLAFDDFGTGYASLSYLTRFPLARIKIDRSFIGKITDDAGDAAIVRSLIAMAHNLGLGVIAEGVETEAQAAFLLNERCEEAQGYLFAKPLPAAEFEAFLRIHPLADGSAAPEKRVSRVAGFQRRSGKPSSRRRTPAAG